MVETIASITAVIVVCLTPYLLNNSITKGLNTMRINRLMDSSTPIHTTGICITSAYCGRKEYRKASPKLAKDKVNEAYKGYFKPDIFCLVTRNMLLFLFWQLLPYHSRLYRHHYCIHLFQVNPILLFGRLPYRHQ